MAEAEREAPEVEVLDGGACVDVDIDRGAREVPRRALNTMSSGLGTYPCRTSTSCMNAAMSASEELRSRRVDIPALIMMQNSLADP